MPGRVNLTHITPRMGVQALSHTPAGDSEGDWLGAGLWAGLGEGARDTVGGEGAHPKPPLGTDQATNHFWPMQEKKE